MNYLFLALWIAVAWRWRHWLWRLFVLVMVVNGAILFARPGARPFGALLVALLVWAWTKPASQARALLPLYCLICVRICSDAVSPFHP